MLLLCPRDPFLSLLLRPSCRRSLPADAIRLSEPIIAMTVHPIQCESRGSISRNWYQPCLYIVNINFQVHVLLHHIPNSFSRDHRRHFVPSVRGLLVVQRQRVFKHLILRRSPFRALGLLEKPIRVWNIRCRGENFHFPLHQLEWPCKLQQPTSKIWRKITTSIVLSWFVIVNLRFGSRFWIGETEERQSREGGQPREGNAEWWRFHSNTISVKSRSILKGIRIPFCT